MATIKYEIEYLIGDEWNYVVVEFKGDIEYDSGAIDYAATHCTNSQIGTWYSTPSINMEDFSYDEKLHSDEENKIIKAFISDKKNANEITGRFYKEYEK